MVERGNERGGDLIRVGAGYVRLAEVFGSDELIEAAARKSYDRGTRTVRDRRTLLRFLLRHGHTSPFEMASALFEIRVPIFVMRQIQRHRTARMNEVSLRYSKADDTFHLIPPDDMGLQSTTNRQGRDRRTLDPNDARIAHEAMTRVVQTAWDAYRFLVGEIETFQGLRFESELTRERGIAREIARTILPLCTMTTAWWQMDLHNLMRFLSLRTAPDVQLETRRVAEAMLELVEPHFPITFAAWRDYRRDALTFTRPECEALAGRIDVDGAHEAAERHPDMSARERREFADKLRKIDDAGRTTEDSNECP